MKKKQEWFIPSIHLITLQSWIVLSTPSLISRCHQIHEHIFQVLPNVMQLLCVIWLNSNFKKHVYGILCNWKSTWVLTPSSSLYVNFMLFSCNNPSLYILCYKSENVMKFIINEITLNQDNIINFVSFSNYDISRIIH